MGEDVDEQQAATVRTRKVHFGDFLSDLAALWVVASAIIKITYKGRIQAEVKAAQATVVTDPMAGAMVVARVVARTRCRPEELIDHCAKNLAPYKVPRRIEFCDAI